MNATALAVAALLILVCGDMRDAWANDPRARLGPIALVLWALALWQAYAAHQPADPGVEYRWRMAAVLACAVSAIAEVNVLAHLGVAAWFCASTPRPWLLMGASLSWMPVLARLFPAHAAAGNLARVLVAGAALVAMVRAGHSYDGGSRCADLPRPC